MLKSQGKSTTWLHIFFIVAVGLILTIPVIVNGYLNAHDFKYHIISSRHFSEQFRQGELYPRWLQNMNAGLGSPTFFFYAPIPYYFTSLFSLLSDYSTSSWNPLALSSSFALVASGLTAYLWLKEIVSRKYAAIASIIYMAWPYHLVVDLYVRFAFAEYWSFVWLPLILYFSLKIVKGSRLNFIGLIISIALLALTHLPTFIIFLPVAMGYALFTADKNQRKIIFICLSIAITVAFGLSAIYWFPAITTQKSISMDALLTKDYYYANNFLFTGPEVGHNKNFWMYLELLTVPTGGLAFSAWKISQKEREATFRREINYWMIIAMLSLFMTLPLSKFVWDILPVIQIIQFSWRFNTILTVATVALFALVISKLEVKYELSNFSKNKNLVFIITFLTLIVFTLTFIQRLPLQEKIMFWGSHNTVLCLCVITFLLLGISFIKKPVNFYGYKFLTIGFLLIITIFLGSVTYGYRHMFVQRINDNEVSRTLQISKGNDEHRPHWVPKEVFNNIGEKDLNKSGEKFPQVQINAGQASLLMRQWQPRKIVLQVNATTDTKLTIQQFYYPGWTAKIEELSQIPVNFSESGLLQISVPTGKHEVDVTLEPLIQERVGSIISSISAILTLFLALKSLLSRDPSFKLGR